MHMPPDAVHDPILMAQGSGDALLDQLRERLAASPLASALWTRLPEGTALVGGAVRDGLLNRLQEQPDLDLVVPIGCHRSDQGPGQEL